MNNLLTKFLTKYKITRETLDPKPILPGMLSEKAQFEKWERILSEDVVSVENIESFCKDQINKIESQWNNFDSTSLKNERLVIAHTIYTAILKTIKAPKVEREALEVYLNSLIDS